MTEYIDKAKALEKAVAIKGCFSKMISAWDVAHIPPADVAEVKHGKWIDIFSREVYIPDEKTTIALTEQKCSECNVVFTFKGDKEYLPDYVCPNCGARMDGEE